MLVLWDPKPVWDPNDVPIDVVDALAIANSLSVRLAVGVGDDDGDPLAFRDTQLYWDPIGDFNAVSQRVTIFDAVAVIVRERLAVGVRVNDAVFDPRDAFARAVWKHISQPAAQISQRDAVKVPRAPVCSCVGELGSDAYAVSVAVTDNERGRAAGDPERQHPARS